MEEVKQFAQMLMHNHALRYDHLHILIAVADLNMLQGVARLGP